MRFFENLSSYRLEHQVFLAVVTNKAQSQDQKKEKKTLLKRDLEDVADGSLQFTAEFAASLGPVVAQEGVDGRLPRGNGALDQVGQDDRQRVRLQRQADGEAAGTIGTGQQRL